MNDLNKKIYESSSEILKLSKFLKSYDWRKKVEKLVFRLVEKSVFGAVEESGKLLLILEVVIGLARDANYLEQENFNEFENIIVSLKPLFLNNQNYAKDMIDLNNVSVLDTRSKIGGSLKSLGEIMQHKITNIQFPTTREDNSKSDIPIRQSAILQQFNNTRDREKLTSKVEESKLKSSLDKRIDHGQDINITITNRHKAILESIRKSLEDRR